MEREIFFSNNFVDIVSKMLTLFAVFIYSIILFNISITTKVKFIFIVFLVTLSVLQFYFLVVKSRIGIVSIYVHLSIMLGFAAFGLIQDLLVDRFHTSDTNGLVIFIVIITLSILIVNNTRLQKLNTKI